MNKLLIPIIIGSILLAVVYLFFSLFESYEETDDLGWSTSAQRNPYLAAEHYLQTQGVNVSSVISFDKIGPLHEIDTLYIDNSQSIFSFTQENQLEQWVKNGGNLIVTAHPPNRNKQKDLLLSKFDITVYDTQCECFKGSKDDIDLSIIENDVNNKNPKKFSDKLRQYNEKIDNDNTDDETKNAPVDIEPNISKQLSSLKFEDISENLQIHFDPTQALEHPFLTTEENTEYDGLKPFYWEGNDYGIQFMQFYAGKGMVTIMVDKSLWQSRAIGDYDHAYLLKILTNTQGSVRILYGSNMPSLFILTWRYAKEIVIALGVWVVLWLLYRARRFGPALQQQLITRRSIGEHIQASAIFLWKQGYTSELLKPLQDDVIHRAKLKIPGYEVMNKQKQYQHLADSTQTNIDIITTALSPDITHNEDSFTHAVQTLQKMKSIL